MKLPQIVDAEDVSIILRTTILFALGMVSMTAVLLGLAAILGLAWVVFQLAGGL